mgnify:CR=1 FL=1
MSSDEYLRGILANIRHPTGGVGPGGQIRTAFLPVLSEWAGTQLVEVALSGSYAKSTAIVGGSDVDLFISLKSDTTQTLKQIYLSLGTRMEAKGFAVRKQSVSINVQYGNHSVDLVPGKKQTPFTTDHSIFVSRLDTWTKTNIGTHITYVVNSGRTDEICILKRWRALHGLEFPSFALELAVVRALAGRNRGQLANNVMASLVFLRDSFVSAALTDPANGSNNVAAELTYPEKLAIATAAHVSSGKQYWREIVW